MKDICPNCEKATELEIIRTSEAFMVRGESIEVEVEYYKCLTCGEEFAPPRSDYDPTDKAYREYRKRHGMLQPEEIRGIRDRYGLTQHEMSKLFGWGFATLSRYENGALQVEAHERSLRLAMEPHNLLKLIEEAPDAIGSKEKKERLVRELRAMEEEANSFEKIYEDRFGQYPLDELCGYKKLDLEKLFNAILYFCKDGLFKTALNKYLFYADFMHFKNNSVSMTGLRYKHDYYGPVPDKYEYYFATLKEEDAISIKEEFFPDFSSGERLITEKQPDLSVFSDTELKVLIAVKEKFKGMTAKSISELSHKEKGYADTMRGQFISYNYAEDISE